MRQGAIWNNLIRGEYSSITHTFIFFELPLPAGVERTLLNSVKQLVRVLRKLVGGLYSLLPKASDYLEQTGVLLITMPM